MIWLYFCPDSWLRNRQACLSLFRRPPNTLGQDLHVILCYILRPFVAVARSCEHDETLVNKVRLKLDSGKALTHFHAGRLAIHS